MFTIAYEVYAPDVIFDRLPNVIYNAYSDEWHEEQGKLGNPSGEALEVCGGARLVFMHFFSVILVRAGFLRIYQKKVLAFLFCGLTW